ncbi:MAG TPA: efflux RND transporter periplasmic adaptor subunit [Pirellulales bacterium]|nr:efflux RND transporter periplasmic adaptor subunit [Pirellulales bacterium]
MPLQRIDPPQTNRPGEPERRTRRSALLGAVPNAVAFALLAGVFYLGHHTGWKLPGISALLAKEAPHADDWCFEHLVPGSRCVECQDDLLPKGPTFGFCRKHGVAECVIDHPELAQVTGEPQLPKYDAVRALALLPRPENNSKNTLHQRRVQFASGASAAKFGIEVDVVQQRPMKDVVTANGELTFDPTRMAHLSSRVSGTVAAVQKTLGDAVRSGDVLVLIDAAQVGEAKSRLLRTIVELGLRRTTAERLRNLASDKLVTLKALTEAEAALKEAKIAVVSARQTLINLGFNVPDDIDENDIDPLEKELHFLDIPAECLAALPPGSRTTNLIPIRAAYDGVVLSSDVVAGEVVDTTQELITVADPGRLWLLLNVRQEDGKDVSLGMLIRFNADDGSGHVEGRISWISPTVDPRTRTLQVRVVLDNADGRLRGRAFGSATIVLREEPEAVVVPVEAVQSSGDAQFVFVRDKDYLRDGSFKLFYPRQVRTGARDGEYVELLAGVLPGEVVATKGSNSLLAQLLRGNLGAGCDCHN